MDILQPSPYTYIDPGEIQCWPPKEVEDAIAVANIEYPDFLDGIAGLLVSRSPRFAQDLAPYLSSYFHDHNLDRPVTEIEKARLAAMIAHPDSIDVTEFERLAPIVLHKATTLAVETFIQNRPGWVLKAIPHFAKIRESVLFDTASIASIS